MDDRLVPDDFQAPSSLEGPGFRLEPLGPEHNERDHQAWTSSIAHIRSTPGFETGSWPRPMSLAANLRDLEAHAEDFDRRRGFTYSVLDGDEVIGCVYIYPSDDPGHDADVRSWVRESRSELDEAVRRAVSEWLIERWPFSNPRYPARVE